MTRLTILGFLLLTGFFYLTGRPLERNLQGEVTFLSANDARFTNRLPATGVPGVVPTESNNFTAPRAALPSPTPEIRPAQPVAIAVAAADALPDMPVRRPSRTASLATAANTAPAVPLDATLAVVTNTSAVSDARREDAVETIDAENSAASRIGAAVPLFQGYQDRLSAAKPPVVGPRLAAVLIKRELRRVGCFDGTITGMWDDRARSAAEAFNSRATTKIETSSPDAASLEILQRAAEQTCGEVPQGSRPILAGVAAGTVTAGALGAVAQVAQESPEAAKPAAVRKTAAYRPARQPNTNNVASSDDDDMEQPQISNEGSTRTATRRRHRRIVAIAPRMKSYAYAEPSFKPKTLVKGWKSYNRRKKFGFSTFSGSFNLDY